MAHKHSNASSACQKAMVFSALRYLPFFSFNELFFVDDIKNNMDNSEINRDDVVDVVLIGPPIMSTTLGMMLKKLNPGITMRIFERLDMVAGESSDA